MAEQNADYGALRFKLETALAYRRRYETRWTRDPWILEMRAANEREIRYLEAKLAGTQNDRSERT